MLRSTGITPMKTYWGQHVILTVSLTIHIDLGRGNIKILSLCNNSYMSYLNEELKQIQMGSVNQKLTAKFIIILYLPKIMKYFIDGKNR